MLNENVNISPSTETEERNRRVALEKVNKVISRAEKNFGVYGTFALFKREVDRFIKIAVQSIFSPILTTLLWFLVFGYSLGERLQEIQGVKYVNFLVPGLVMMALITNSFMNSAFSFFIGKLHGTVLDLLVSPLKPWQIIIAYTSATALRASIIGGVIWMVAAIMGADTFHNVGITLLFLFLTATGFGLLGLTCGIMASNFDYLNLIPNFFIMPLTFLGGVFYSIDMLPEPWQTVSQFNPILYMVNGIRYGMAGVTDVSIPLGLTIVSLVVLIGFAVNFWLLTTGKYLRQ